MGSALAASAQNTTPFAAGFSEHTVTIAGRPVHYLIGGKGPAVLLVHGYGDTGEMWRPLAPLLAKTHLVIVPDLPGLGDSRPQSPTAPYDMAATARILHGLLLSQNMRRDAVVGHDIGLMAADAYAAAIPKQRDAAGPDGRTEALVAARERIYLDRILDAFAYHPTSGLQHGRKAKHRLGEDAASDARSRHGRGQVVRHVDAALRASCRNQRSGKRYSRCRTLADGREPARR
jgi:pimeloyl-ACP methyl ester carboxylesterase